MRRASARWNRPSARSRHTIDLPGPRPGPLRGGVLTPPLREKFVQNPDTEAQLLQAGQAQPEPEPIMIELILRYQAGVAEAVQRVLFLWRLVGGAGEPIELADQYLAGDLSTSQLEGIVSADAAAGDWPKRAIYRIWLDFEVHPQIDASSGYFSVQRGRWE
jgi:serine protease AprX